MFGNLSQDDGAQFLFVVVGETVLWPALAPQRPMRARGADDAPPIRSSAARARRTLVAGHWLMRLSRTETRRLPDASLRARSPRQSRATRGPWPSASLPRESSPIPSRPAVPEYRPSSDRPSREAAGW